MEAHSHSDSELSYQSNRETFPNFIYVSELLRTWETAVLLFCNSINTELTLFISPFLREREIEIGIGLFPSDKPGDLKEQIREFIRFISFLRFLKKKNINDISNLIPDDFIIYLKHFSGPFSADFIDGIEQPEGVTFSIRRSGDHDAHNGCIFISFISGEIDDLGSTSDKSHNPAIIAMSNIISQRLLRPDIFNYVNYGSNTPYPYDLVFPPPSPSTQIAIGDMTIPSEPAGSLADFLNWYKGLHPKPHSESNIHNSVFLVSHLGTLDRFIESVISRSGTKPYEQFVKEYKEAMKTNTFSLVVKVHGISDVFNVFRHAYSCDNRYMDKGLQSLGQRLKAGEYTNLTLWGILSTLIFSNRVINNLVNKTKDIHAESAKDIRPESLPPPPPRDESLPPPPPRDESLPPPPRVPLRAESVLQICRGVDYEPDHLHTANYDSVNLLCGEQRNRMATKNFNLVFGHCGTNSSSVFKYTLDENCIRITMTTTLGSKSKVVLFLDKGERKIQARFFTDVEKSKTYVNKIVLKPTTLDENLSSIISHIINPQNRPKSLYEYIEELKDEITSFISRNKLDPRWDGTAWGAVWYGLIGKEDEWEIVDRSELPKQSALQGQYASSSSESGRSPFPPADTPQSILGFGFGGTIKKTRRHRHRHKHKKYKVMKKYTRKNKKYKPKPTKKFKRTQKHKKIHKYRSRKYRK